VFFSLAQTSAAPKPDQSDKPDFNGTWTLDLKASASLEPIMKKVGASLLEQKFASRTHLDQNQTGKRGPTDRHKVPDKPGENRGRSFHPKAQRRTRPNLCPPNLAQASLSLVTGVVASQKSTTACASNNKYYQKRQFLH
jgi:hypothetical protein